MVAPTDGLSLADRIAKRQKEEKKLAEELAGQEKERLLKYDKTKLPLHQQVFAAIKKVREAYDKAKSKEDVEKIRTAQQKAIDATGKKMVTIDPKGGNSNVVTDYDVMLDALSNGYPDALSVSFGGDKQPLDRGDAPSSTSGRRRSRPGWPTSRRRRSRHGDRRRAAEGARGASGGAARGAGGAGRRLEPGAGARPDSQGRPPGGRARRRSSSARWRRSWAR